MGIYLSIKNKKKGKDYLFVDELSEDCYESALFRVSVRYDTLKMEHIDVIDEYLQTSFNNLIEVLNEAGDIHEMNGTHEDRIRQLENEIATLSNSLVSQTTSYGILRITPTSNSMDFNKDGTMFKFTNSDGGVYTTSILQSGVPLEIRLPIGTYTVNIVNSLNDIKDSVFSNIWENAISTDGNYTMNYVVEEGTLDLNVNLEYE